MNVTVQSHFLNIIYRFGLVNSCSALIVRLFLLSVCLFMASD